MKVCQCKRSLLLCPMNNRPPQPTIAPWGNGVFMFDQILTTIG
ncbi:hypothetical protein [Nostoc flagelliforme]|nr:hypothetical protein [Nostoc flagelliforme]